MRTETPLPTAATFTSAPLRNRIRVELKAPASDVWSLLGDLPRSPEYSVGIERIEAKTSSSGVCTEYVCHFKPQQQGGEPIVHRELMRWYEPNRGYASESEEPNAFGLTGSITMMTIEPSKEGTLMTWNQYYNAADLEMMRGEFDRALADMGERLASRFGGRVVDRYVDGPR